MFPARCRGLWHHPKSGGGMGLDTQPPKKLLGAGACRKILGGILGGSPKHLR